MTTLINKCTCKSPFQDKEYGEGMRLHNETLKNTAICTVCGNTLKTDIVKKKK